MQTWSITLYGPAGVISAVDTGESQFVVGTETASDVFTVHGDGVTERHAWVWISEAGLQVEDLGGGTLVNGYQINERVQVEYPASVQVGELTLVIEVKAVQPVAVSPTPSSLDITIPQRAVAKTKASMDVTIPQRTPTRSNVQRAGSTATSSPQSTPANKAPLTGEYTLVKEIARGGMGQIYFGEDPQLKRNVAVKVSSVSEAGEDPRFSKEAEVLAQLAHPNIVPIYNIGVDAQSRPFYSMKLIKGRTLQAVLNLIRDGDANANKEYPRATLLTIFRKVCDAMMFAHSKGILHRDLKPENIMVGEYGEVLVMDWGLAKVLGEREDNVSTVSRVNDTGDYGMTMEGEVMGTPQYMSPEQAMGMVAELDQRSDTYSLGGILYAILTLRPPIDGTTLDEVLTKVKNGSISSMVTKRGGKGGVTVGVPAAMGAEVPEALQAVTLKAMATDRNKRYESVEAFAGDIERYQNGFATNAEGAGALRQIVLLINRHKAISLAAALIFLTVLGFTFKLAASERIARQLKDKALVAFEKSRIAAASAQIALAEANEQIGDSTELKRALDAVPEDLQNQDWRYLKRRQDSADFCLTTPQGLSWLGIEDFPSEQGQIAALRSDGEVSMINVKNGGIKRLWRYKPSREGTTSGVFGITPDGSAMLLSYREKGQSTVTLDVCEIRDGRLLQALRGSSITVAQQICVASDLFILEGIDARGEKTLEIWDLVSAKLLWQTPGYHSSFSLDEASVLLITKAGQVERREARTGGTIAMGMSGVVIPHPDANQVWTSKGTSNFAKVFSSMGSNSRIRLTDPWSAKVAFEISPRYGNSGVALIPPGNSFAVIGKVSHTSAVIEIRSAISGELKRTLLLCGRFHSGLGRIIAKREAVLHFSRETLQIWLQDSLEPVHLFYGGGVRLGSTSKLMRVDNRAGQINAQLLDGASSAAKGKILQERTATGSTVNAGSPFVQCSADGERVLFGIHGFLGAFNVDHSEILEKWSIKKVAGGYLSAKLHPTIDLVWAGERVLQFSSGKEISVINRSSIGQVRSYSPVWVGTNRIVEIILPISTAVDSNTSSESTSTLALWDTESGELLVTKDAHRAVALCASPDGMSIAEGGNDRRVRIRNGKTLEIEREFRVHEDAVVAIAWHPTKSLLVTASKDTMIRIWDLKNLKTIEEFSAQAVNGSSLSITLDGFELSVPTTDGSIKVYRPKSFTE